MEETSHISVREFGGRVASVWEGLRPATRGLVERALQTPATGNTAAPRAASATYDARSEWELSRLLAALDDRAGETSARPGEQPLSAELSRELCHVTEACAAVLHRQARSAEVFAQLLERVLRARDYRRVDALADTLATRLAPTEVCELARHRDPAVRALAQETLAQTNTSVLIDLLGDPVDAETARVALEAQADEYGLEEARWVVNALERADEDEDEA